MLYVDATAPRPFPRPIPAATELACCSAAGDMMRNATSMNLALALEIILAILALQNFLWTGSVSAKLILNRM